MLHNYQTLEFGKRIRDIRHGLNLTQQDVSDASGINLDTLRKIENGYVVPRYDTLEILSIVYKTDILEVFKNYRFTSDLYEIYNMLDRYIVDYHVQNLDIIRDKIDKLDERVYNTIVLADEISKLKTLVEAIYIVYKNERSPDESQLKKAKEMLINALEVHNPEFTLEQVTCSKYTYFDIRLLIILSHVVKQLNDSQLSNIILEFILSISDKSSHASFMEKLLVIKIYTNIAYNHYNMDNPNQTLKYSNEGIDFALDNSLMYNLPLLFMRKGIAQLKLGIPAHTESIKRGLYLLEVQGNTNLKSIYEQVLKSKYKIVIE